MAALCGVFVLFALGPSLVGAKVFSSADLVLSYAPWKATQSATATPDNACASDPVDGFAPAAAEFRRQALDGDLAMWSPLATGGAPLAAVPSFATWSPLSLPLLALPTWLGLAWMKLLELVVSTGGMYLLCRRLSLARAPALLGGLVFSTSGFMITWTGWPHTRTAAFAPVLLWSLERLLQLRTRRAVLPVAGSVACMLLGGFPEVTGFALYLAAPYVLLRLLAGRRPEDRVTSLVRPGLLAAVGVALGGLVVAFQLVPFLSQIGGLDLTSRAQTPSQHLPMLSLVTAALPKAFGTCPDRTFAGPVNEIESMAYIGSGVLVLVVVALLRRNPEVPRGVRGFFVGAAAVSVVLGWYGGPLLKLAQHLPVFTDNPVARIRVILGLCLAVLGAMGYDALLRGIRSSKRRLWLELGVWAVVGLGALLALRALRNDLRPTGHLAASDRQTVYAGLAALAVLAAVAVARTRLSRLALALVPVVVLVQALNVVLPFWPQIPREDFYPTTATHEFLAKNLGHERMQGLGFAMFPGTNVYYGLRSLGGHGFTATTWRELMETADSHAFRTPSFSTLDAAPELFTSTGLDRMSLKYLVLDGAQGSFGTVESYPLGGAPVVVAAGKAVTVPLPGGHLRGVTLSLTSAPAVDGMLDVAVVQGSTVIASSGRRLLPKTGPGRLTVGLAGESAPSTGLSLRLTNTTSGPVTFDAGSAGPVAEVVRPADDGLRVVQATASASVWQRLNALPRFRWASDVIVAAQGPASLKAASTLPPAPGHVVLASNPVGAHGAAGTVKVVHDGPDAMSLDVRSGGSGYVVVADGLQPGSDWTATVDGKRVDLLRADHAVVAVPLTAGSHAVRLAYAPKGQRDGVLLSLLGLAALLGLTSFRTSRTRVPR